MPEEDEKLVVPGGERNREVAAPAAVSHRQTVHEERARAHRADPESAGGRRPVQAEPRRQGQGRGLSGASLRAMADPPGSGERVGKTGPRGQGRAREDEERDGVREETARGLPRTGR